MPGVPIEIPSETVMVQKMTALPPAASASIPLNVSFQCSAAPGFLVAVHSMRHMPPIWSRPFREKASSSNVALGA